MRNIILSFAGLRQNWDEIFVTSRHRKNSGNYTIFHHNDSTTEFRIPADVFKANFRFERSSGIYRTKLSFGDLRAIQGVKETIYNHAD